MALLVGGPFNETKRVFYSSQPILTSNNTTSSLVILKDNTLSPIYTDVCKTIEINVASYVDDGLKNKYFHYKTIWIVKYDSNGDLSVPVKNMRFNINAASAVDPVVYATAPTINHLIIDKQLILSIICPAFTSLLGIYSNISVELLGP